MTVWEAFLLGLIQGLTEFFPVSSSGHLVLAQAVMEIEIPGIVFDVAVHVATLLSVLVVYRAKLAELVQGMFRKGDDSSWGYILKVGLATIPAVIVGLGFEDYFEARFDDPMFAGTMILVTGSFVWSSRWATGIRRFGPAEVAPIAVAAVVAAYAGSVIPFLAVLGAEALLMGFARRTAPRETVADPGWTGALLIGMAQSLAILPGISRSGSTVLTGLWRRIDPVAAAEFSFLMSIPAILGAAVLQLPEAMSTGLSVPPATLAAGFIAAAVAGVLAIRFFVALLRRQNFYIFAYYCWIAASLFLIFGE